MVHSEDCLHIIIGILAVVGAFGFIIFIHELGHLVVARRVGIRCPEFAIGFGKVLFEFRWKGTRCALRMVPVGGYVQMIGEDPQADTQDSWHEVFTSVVGEVDYPTTPDAVMQKIQDCPPPEGRRVEWETVCEHLANQPKRLYRSQEALEGNFNAMTIPERVAVVLGGVFMNFAAAILLMWFLSFTVGNGDFVRFHTNHVDSVLDSSVAQEAGLRPHDTIVNIAGHPVSSGADLLAVFGQYPGQRVQMEVLRKKQSLTVPITPDVSLDGSRLHLRAKGGDTVVGLVDAVFDKEYLAPAKITVGSKLIAIDGHAVQGVDTVVTTLRETLTSRAGQDVELHLTFADKGAAQNHTIVMKAAAADLLPQGRVGVQLMALNQLLFTTKGNDLIESVTPNSIAASIGLQPEDRIISINNIEVTGYEAIGRVLSELSTSDFSHERAVPIRVLRKEDAKTFLLRQAPPTAPEAFGLKLVPLTTGARLAHPFLYIRRFCMMPYMLVSGLISGAASPKEVGKDTQGPLGIMQSIYEIAQNGWPAIFFFLAILNAAVGSFNLIPFPALDGMRCLLLFVSAVRRRELNPEKEAIFHFVGLVVLLGLVLFVTLEDVKRLMAGTAIMK